MIEVDAAGKYDGDVAFVRNNKLTFRGVGAGRALLDSQGNVAGGKAIFVTSGDDITIENLEFHGARCGSRNGARVRYEGSNLTLRRCKFQDCENGILGGGGNGELLRNNTFVNDHAKAAYTDLRLTEDDFKCAIREQHFRGQAGVGRLFLAQRADGQGALRGRRTCA